MTARFAGSRSLDDRRRRRLATDTGDAQGGQAATTAADVSDDAETPTLRPCTRFPLRKVISKRGWKVWGVAGLLLLGGAGLLGGSLSLNPSALTHGPAVVAFLDPAFGRMPSLFMGGCLLAASQLSLLIGWMRSRSYRDFDGRYQIWYWASAVLTVLAITAIGQLHLLWAEVAPKIWQVKLRHWPTLCWLIPLGVPTLLVADKLRKDVAGCRASWSLLWLAGLGTAALTGFQLGLVRTSLGLRSDAVLASGLSMLTGWSVFASMLLHARHVVHFSAEPPTRKLTWWQKLCSREWWAERFRGPRESWQRWQNWLATGKQRREEKRAARAAAKAEQAAARDAAKLAAREAREQAAAERKAEAEAKAAEKAAARAAAQAAREEKRRKHAAAEPEAGETAPPPKKPARQAAMEQPAADNETSRQDSKRQANHREDDDRYRHKEDAPEPVAEPAPARQPQPESRASTRDEYDEDDGEAFEFDFDPSKPLTSDMMKGLSKSQRRKLRKEYREAQRRGKAA